MKVNKFFLGLALIGAILTGCDKGQEPETNGGEAKAYMSVRISMASSAGTRASEAGFEAGLPAEQTITVANSIFLFYDDKGNWVTSGQLATGDAVYEDGDCDINTLSNTIAYIVLSGPDEELQKSAQVLTVVNYPNKDELKNLNLKDALAKTTTVELYSASSFLMSTSVYYDKTLDDANDELYPNGIVNTTAIDASKNIRKSANDAKDNPVVIHIERAAAKAQLSTASADYLLTGDKQIVVDGILSDVTVAINGWTLNNVYKETYLVKKLQEAWAADATKPFDTWNWTEGRRSYWAEGHNWRSDKTNKTIYAYQNATLAPDGVAPMYCYENTVESPKCGKGEPDPNVNTVLIAAQFKVGSESYQNLYEYAGVFYREETYKKVIIEQLKAKGYKKNGADFKIADVLFKVDGTSLAGIKFALVEDATAVYTEGVGTSDKATIEAYVNATDYIKEALGYAAGKCFYQIPVEHLGAVGKSAQYGMVRNHVYKIAIKSVNHVGEPVYDPEVVIPGIPDETLEHYLAAEIHILSWHVVKQSVDL